MAASRRSNGQFAPGHSGNPSGKPKVIGELREALREDVPEIRKKLREFWRDEKNQPRERLEAMRIHLEHALGKAPQYTEVDSRILDEREDVPREKPDLADMLRRAGVMPKEDGEEKEAAEQQVGIGHL